MKENFSKINHPKNLVVEARKFVDEVKSNLTEMKMTIYAGEVNSKNAGWGNVKSKTQENMVYDATIYNQWFNNLRAEIDRR